MKKKLIIIGIIVALAAAFFASLFFIPAVREIFVKKIKVGVISYPPMSSDSGNGNFNGFDCSVATEIFEELGYKVIFTEVTAENRAELLKSGEIDCYMSHPANTENADLIFSKSYISSIQATLYKNDSGVELDSSDELVSYTCGVQKNSGNSVFLKKEYPEIKVSEFLTAADTLTALKNGTVQIAVMDYFHIASLFKNSPAFTDDYTSGILVHNNLLCIAFDKDNTELRDKVNEQLSAMNTADRIAYYESVYSLEDYLLR